MTMPGYPTPDEQQPFEGETARSSVKLTRNSKGQTQFEIKVYAPEDNDVDFAATKAIAIHERLSAEFPWT